VAAPLYAINKHAKNSIIYEGIMKKVIIVLLFVLGAQASVLSNPIYYPPNARISELVFDSFDHWTMELTFSPIGYQSFNIDSIVLKVSNNSSKLNFQLIDGSQIGIITADSLLVPLNINRAGDKIEVVTYMHQLNSNFVLKDSLIFGNYAGATVGVPVNGNSILRYTTKLVSNNFLIIDCLTKHPSLGVANDTAGLSGKLKGHLYDMNNRLITNYYFPTAGQGLLLLESVLNFNFDGTYSTPIFNTIYNPGHLLVNIVDFGGFSDTLEIEPFQLIDIHPDTVVIQDIHLKDTCYHCSIIDAVINSEPPQSDELTLINYPNPFNLSTNFFVKIPASMKGKPGSIAIYNVNGQLIRDIPINEGVTAYWDGKDAEGRIMSSGNYFYRLNIDKQVMKTGSMILLK